MARETSSEESDPKGGGEKKGLHGGSKRPLHCHRCSVVGRRENEKRGGKFQSWKTFLNREGSGGADIPYDERGERYGRQPQPIGTGSRCWISKVLSGSNKLLLIW